jgi:hypothetical protein
LVVDEVERPSISLIVDFDRATLPINSTQPWRESSVHVEVKVNVFAARCRSTPTPNRPRRMLMTGGRWAGAEWLLAKHRSAMFVCRPPL